MSQDRALDPSEEGPVASELENTSRTVCLLNRRDQTQFQIAWFTFRANMELDMKYSIPGGGMAYVVDSKY